MNEENCSSSYGAFHVPGLIIKTIGHPENIIFIYSLPKLKSIGIYFNNGYILKVKVKMKYMQNRLDPANFFRSHKLFIVNMNFVDEFWYVGRCLVLRMKNKVRSEVPVSRKKVKSFLQKRVLFDIKKIKFTAKVST